MSNKILKEDEVSKAAAWLLPLHQGTLSVVAINVFKHQDIFLEPSCPWPEPNRQSNWDGLAAHSLSWSRV